MVDKIGYESTVKQLELLQKEGPLGVKCDEKLSFVKRPWLEKISLMATLLFSRLSPEQTNELTKIHEFAKLKVQALNSAHQQIKPDSSYFKSYFSAAKTIQLWNNVQGGLQQWLIKRAGFEFNRPKVDYSGLVETNFSVSSSHLLTFAYNSQDKSPLIIAAKETDAALSQLFPEEDNGAFQNLLQAHSVLLLKGVKQDKSNEDALRAIFGDDIIIQIGKGEIKVIEKDYHDAQAIILKEKKARETQQLLTLLVMQRNIQLTSMNHRAYGR